MADDSLFEDRVKRGDEAMVESLDFGRDVMEVGIYPVDESRDLVWIYHLEGEDAAIKELEALTLNVSYTSRRRCLPRLERWFGAFRTMQIWILAAMCASALIEILAHGGEDERCAARCIDLGEMLLVLGDARSIECFRRALALAANKSEIHRGYSRLGDAFCLLEKDWDSAKASYREASFRGEAENENLHRMLQRRMMELELDREDRSEVFGSLREDIQEIHHFARRSAKKVRLPRDPGSGLERI